MFCSKCGSEIKSGIKFCPKCGNKIDHAQTRIQPNTNQSQNTHPGTNTLGKGVREFRSKAQKSSESKRQIVSFSILIGYIACIIAFIFPLGTLRFEYITDTQSFTCTDVGVTYIIILVGIIGAVLVYLKKYKFTIITSGVLLYLFSIMNEAIDNLVSDNGGYFSYGAGHTLILIGVVVSLIGSIFALVLKIDNASKETF